MERILIFDKKDRHEQYERALDGFSVQCFSTLNALQLAVMKEHPRLILADWSLAREAGLVRSFRTVPDWRRHFPVVFIDEPERHRFGKEGERTIEDIRRLARDAGATDFLPREPWKKFGAAVRSWLRVSRENHHLPARRPASKSAPRRSHSPVKPTNIPDEAEIIAIARDCGFHTDRRAMTAFNAEMNSFRSLDGRERLQWAFMWLSAPNAAPTPVERALGKVALYFVQGGRYLSVAK